MCRLARGSARVILAVATLAVAAACGGSSHPTASHLPPAPLGHAQCHATRLVDHSVLAQIATAHTNCLVADVIALGADKAAGRSYATDGFSCRATIEGSGSTWRSAWTGTYYSYDCAEGAAQVAFNWGTHYVYGMQSAGTTTPGPSPSTPAAAAKPGSAGAAT